MDILQGFIQPPKQQSAEDTIPTLCDRVENSTLISDRRSAVLGLKSFSRQYREAVIASGLKPLINTLEKDYEDLETGRAILETLLILFIRGEGEEDKTRGWISQNSRLKNGKYPSPLVMKQEEEPLDQFSLWIADALIQSPNLMKIIFELMTLGNFHLKVYTIQILEALVATRPSRTREAIINFPTAISQLVSLLNDFNDAIRDEAILLLMAIVNGNTHIQSLVAFENIFEKLLSIILEEGGIRGSLVVNDCLSLISNILKYNTANQTLFLESGSALQVAKLLQEILDPNEDFYWNEQRILNLQTLFSIMEMLVEPGNKNTAIHQKILFDSGVLMLTLQLAFYNKTPKAVRPFSLDCASMIIRGNSALQEKFGQIDVPMIDPSMPSPNTKDVPLVPVTRLLLHWFMNINSVHFFDIRVTASNCMKAYLYKNTNLQLSFLTSQIAEFNGEMDKNLFEVQGKNTNVFTTLLEYNPDLSLNPYKLYFAVDFLLYLFDNAENSKDLKKMVQTLNGTLSESNSLETLCELFLTCLTMKDIRISFSYLSLLVVWLFEDFDAANGVLSSKSNVKQFLSYCTKVHEDNVDVKCLATMVLGVAYEFSTQKSPIPRSEYHGLLSRSISSDNYRSRVKQFLESDIFKKSINLDLAKPTFDETGLPEIYFSPVFVKLVKLHHEQIEAALTHDPSVDPQEKLTYETFENVQKDFSQLTHRYSDLEVSTNAKIETLEERLKVIGDEHLALQKKLSDSTAEKETVASELQKLKQDFDAKASALAALEKEKTDLLSSKTKSEAEIQLLKSQLNSKVSELEQLRKNFEVSSQDKEKAEAGINKMSKELMTLMKEKSTTADKIKELKKSIDVSKTIAEEEEAKHDAVIQTKDAEINTLKSNLADLQRQISDSETSRDQLEKELNDIKSRFASHDALLPKLTEKLKSLAADYKSLERENRSKNTEHLDSISKMEAELEQAKSDLQEVSEERDALKTENDDLLTSFDSFEQELDLTKEKLAAKNSQLEKVQKEYAAKINELEGELKDLKATAAEKGLVHDQLKTRTEELEASVATFEREAGETSTRLEDFEKQVEFLKKSVSLLESANGEKDVVIAELQEKSKDLNSQLEKQKSIETNLLGKIKEATVSYEGVEKEKETLDEMIKTLKIELDKTLGQLSDCKTETSSELSGFKENLEMANEERRILEKDLKEVTDNLQVSEQKLQKMEEEKEKNLFHTNEKIAEFDRVSTSLKSENEDLKKQIESLQAKLAEKDNVISTYENDITESNKRLDNLQSEKSSISSELDAAKQKLANSAEKVALLQAEKEALEANFSETSTNLTNLNVEKTALQAQLESLKSELSEHKLKIEKLEAQNHSNLEENQQKVLELQKSLEEMGKHKSKVESEINIKSKELGEKIKDIDELKQTCENLEAELASAKTTITSLQSVETQYKSSASFLEEKLHSLEKSNDSTKETLTLKTQEVSALKEEKISLQSSLSAANTELEDVKAKFKILENDKKLLAENNDVTIKSQEKEIESLRLELNRLKKELSTKISEFEKERKMLNEGSNSITQSYVEKIGKLEEQLAEKEANNLATTTTLENNIAEVQTKFRETQKRLTEIKEELDVSKKDVTQATQKVSEKDALIAERILELASSNEALAKKEKELTLASEKYKSALSDMENNATELNALKEKILEAENSISLKEQKIQSLSDKVSTLEAQVDSEKHTADQTKQDNQKEITLLKAEITNHQKTIQKLNLEKEEVTENLKKLSVESAEIEKLETALTLKESEISSLNTKVFDLEQEQRDLKDLHSKFESEKNVNLEELKNIENEHKNKIEDLLEQLRSLKDAASLKDSDIEKSAAEVERLSNDLEACAEKLKIFEEEKQKQSEVASQEKKDLQVEIDNLKSKLQMAEAETTENKKLWAEKTTEMEALMQQTQSSHQTIEKEQEDLSKEVESLKLKLSEKETKISELLEIGKQKDESDVINNKLKSSLEQSELENEKLKNDVARLTTIQNDAQQKSKTELQAIEERHHEEIVSLQTALEKYKKQTSDNTELDELTLLVNELDESNKKYRNRLKELGEEFSSDEEEDDDDDDDDDDESQTDK
ncbi:hypothetical protein ACO0RG_002026 [Hanseniaspora osmophila]